MTILFLVGIGILIYLVNQGGGFSMGDQSEKISGVYDLTTLKALATQKAQDNGLEPALVFAIIKHESNWNPSAVNPSDPSYGLMQLNAHFFGVVTDPSENLRIGCQLLGDLMSRYDMSTAIQMYNAGEQGFLNGVRVPAYLADVLKWYAYYQING
jgi:soluble lytic murein transglycosylase-like protein